MKFYIATFFVILSASLSVQAAESKEVDFSGLSQFKPGDASPGAPKYKASCSSRQSGKFNSDEKGFDACLSEVQQGALQGTRKDRDNANGLAPAVEFKTEVK